MRPSTVPGMPGTLALVGGAEWRGGCDFDRDLLEASGTDEVLVLPTGAAFEQPERTVEAATHWFAELGATVRPHRVLTRPDALDPANVGPVARRPLRLPRRRVADAPADGPEGQPRLGRARGRLGGRRHPGRHVRRGDGPVRPDGRPPRRRPHPRARPAHAARRHPAPRHVERGQGQAHDQDRPARASPSSASTSAPPCCGPPTASWSAAGAGSVTVYVDHRQADLSSLSA